MNNKEYKFINEKILLKKKPPFKKIMLGVILTITFGALFGIVARFTFETSGKLFEGKYAIEKRSKKEIDNEKDKNKKVEPKGRKRSKKQIKIKTVKVVEKRVAATLSDYKNALIEFGNLIKEKNKAVVEVQTVVTAQDWFENPYEIVNMTPGYIIKVTDKYVYILGSYKDIKKGATIKLHFSEGFTLDGVVKNYNPELDIVLITAELNENQKGKITVLDVKSSTPRIGEPIMAIGNPNGNMYSVLTGKVTGLNATEYISDYSLEAFFTDINIAKKGNAVFLDFEGNLIGIRSKTEEDACKVILFPKILKFIYGMIDDKPQPYLGIKVKNFEGAFEKTGIRGGILVDGVRKGSPVAQFLKNEDIIYEMDGMPINNITNYESFLESKKPRDKVKLLIYRVNRNKGQKIELELEIGERYKK